MVKSKLFISGTTFVILSALFFTVFHNVLFFDQSWRLVQSGSLHKFMFSASMPVVLFCLLNIVFSAILLPGIRKIVVIVLLLVGAAVNYFMFSFNTVIDAGMVENALETNAHETLDLMTWKMLAWLLMFGVLPSLIVLRIAFKPVKSWWKSGAVRCANVIVSALVVLLIAAFFYKDYASLFRNNRELVKLLVPSNAVIGLVKAVNNRIDAARPFVEIGLDAKKGAFINAQSKKTLMILVVGETARAENFSLAGYAKETNPHLSARKDALFFNNVSSCGTATAVSVPCMFSKMDRQNYDAATARHQSGALDILATAGVNVLWRENDGGCKGVCDRVPTVDVTKLGLNQFCKDGACLDEALLYQLGAYIDGLHDDSIIVLHQMGSHGPSYHRRYTSAERKFSPTCDTNSIQDCDTESLINTYDNTIVYTDKMLDKAIKLLEQYDDKFETIMVYLSDHGESLGENGLYLHGAPYGLAPQQQTQVPMIAWMSQSYRNSRSVNADCLANAAKGGAFSHDNLFHTLLGIFDIQTSEYRSDLDMFKPCTLG